jgi:hypothetical protein
MTTNQLSDGKNAPTSIANIASGECHQVGTAGSGIVAMPVGTQPISNGSGQRKRGDVTQWLPSPGYQFPVLSVEPCEYCGASMEVKRNTGAKRKRFCSVACRVAAHRQREAGGGDK